MLLLTSGSRDEFSYLNLFPITENVSLGNRNISGATDSLLMGTGFSLLLLTRVAWKT